MYPHVVVVFIVLCACRVLVCYAISQREATFSQLEDICPLPESSSLLKGLIVICVYFTIIGL